ncbi:MAG: signal peptide peptidase SppA [Nitrospirota bacterium]
MNRKPMAFLIVGIIVAVALIIALSTGASLFLGRSPMASSGEVAVVRIEGVILSSRDIISQLKKYSKDASVKAIVLRINSPGGAVVPSQEIYEEINKIRAKTGKKIVVSMGIVAASGGYYIASAADKILANPGTLTGSIGVIMEFASVQQLLKKIGIKDQTIAVGKRKDVGDFMRTMTPDEREYLKKVLQDVHGQFVEAVAKGRKMKTKDVWALADGSVYTGRQAKELGLVDSIGDLDDAVNTAGKMAGIQGKPKVITEEKKTSIWDLIKGKDASSLFQGLIGKNLQGMMYLYAAPEIR